MKNRRTMNRRTMITSKTNTEIDPAITEKALEQKEEINISALMNDVVCKRWIIYTTAEPKQNTSEWFKEKQDYWNKNHDYLESKGFKYHTNINGALDFIKCEKETEKGLEGSLLIIRIGSTERPATKQDMDLAHESISKTLKGIPGVRVLVTHHDFQIEKISLPQLRNLQSKVLSSTEDNYGEAENANPIIGLEL
jgi:type IV secretory pathway VirD2 relaxase